MIKDSFCCPGCFNNQFIQQFIKKNYKKIGECPYCKGRDSNLIELVKMGKYFRECIEKAYEGCDDGTGAMYDSEEDMYLGPDFEMASMYSIRDILLEEEAILSEEAEETSLIDDLFENLYSVREIQKGAYDPFDDIDSQGWVVRDNLYGYEQTGAFYAWESFKHMIKHNSRFFDPPGVNLRREYLEKLDSYVGKFAREVPSGVKFYRARKKDDSLPSIDAIEPYSQMGPPPVAKASTNRMSPAGIPYLYVAADKETTIKECRICPKEEAIIAEFVLTKKLKILDLSENIYVVADSIFDPEYNHDNTWMNEFLQSFVKEISQPVSEEKGDHSYEYAPTQLMAEYYKIKGYDGICYKSSLGEGRNYVIFVGPDPRFLKSAYPYPYADEYFGGKVPIIRAFTEVFRIERISQVDSKLKMIKERLVGASLQE